MESWEIAQINEDLWEDKELAEEVSGYKEYCKTRSGSRLSFIGWLKHLKYFYDQNKEKA